MKNVSSCVLLCSALCSAGASGADHLWQTAYTDACITNAACWQYKVGGVAYYGNGWMTNTADDARLWQSKPGSFRFQLPTCDVNPSYLAFYQMADSTLVFDGEDAVFSAPAVPADQSDRSALVKPLSFFWKSGNYQSFTLEHARNALYTLSNVLWRVQTTFPGGDTAASPDITMDFSRGFFGFAGTDGDSSVALRMNGNADTLLCPRSMTAIVTNSIVEAGTFVWAGHATNTLLHIGRGGKMSITGNFDFGVSTDATTCGTNTLAVTDGGTLSGAPSGTDAYENKSQFGCKVGDVFRWNRLSVSGAGSSLDLGDHDSVKFRLPTEIAVSDGGRLVLPRSAVVVPEAGRETSLTIDGEDSVVIVSTKKADASSGILTTKEGAFTLNMRGGLLTGPDGVVLLKFAESSSGAASAVINHTGGRIIHRSSDRLMLGVNGSCRYELSGGELHVGAGVHFGSGTPTGEQCCVFEMTGGSVVNEGDCFFGSSSSYWTHIVRLNGGVFKSGRLLGSESTAAKLCFEGDGGTWVANKDYVDSGYPFFYGFSEAVIGEKGLTIDTAGYSLRIRQAFADKEGETGELRFVGTGSVLLDATETATTVSRIEISRAKVVVQSGHAGMASAVSVTDGGRLDLVSAPAGFSLSALSLGDEETVGALVVTPQTSLLLGAFCVTNGNIVLNGDFDNATTYVSVRVAGNLEDDTASLWARVLVSGDIPSGYAARTSTRYDAEKNATELLISFEEAEAPANVNTWQGGASWDDAAAWSGGQPGIHDVATFNSADPAATVEITVDTLSSSAGALSFAAGDHVFTGAGSILLADTGYDTFITVASGTQTIGVPLNAVRNLNVTVAEDAALKFEKRLRVYAGQLNVNTNYSNGRVELSGEGNLASDGVRLGGGTLFAESPDVFAGFSEKTLFEVCGYATLRVGGNPGDDVFRLPFDLYLKSRNWGSPQVVWNDAPILVQSFRSALSAGVCPVKMGEAALVFESSEGMSVRLSQTNGRMGSDDYTTLPSAALAIPETTGSVAWDYSFSGLNVVEGELRLAGSGTATPSSTSQAFGILCVNLIGVRSINVVSAAPGLVLDHCYALAQNGNGNRTLLCANAYEGEFLGEGTNAYLSVVNGSTLDAGTLELGHVSDPAKSVVAVRPRVAVSNSVCSVAKSLVLSARSGCDASWSVSDGSLYSGTDPVVWNGGVDGRVDGDSVFAAAADGTPATFAAGADATGELVFADGAVCRATASTAETGASASVAFDGGRLVVPDGSVISFAEGCALKAEGKGLLLDVPAGETWTLASSVSGTGAVELRGDGTLALSGTLSAAFAGDGVISGGTLSNARLRPTVDGKGAVTETLLLDNVGVSGRITVDLGHGAEDPLSFSDIAGKTVARYAGLRPDVSNFRLTGVNGLKVYGSFSASDGKIVLTDAAERIGTTVIVR